MSGITYHSERPSPVEEQPKALPAPKKQAPSKVEDSKGVKDAD